MSRLDLSLAGGLASIFAGALVAGALMLYRTLADGVSFTVESWIAIPSIWTAVAILWAAAYRWSFWAITPAILLATFAGVYFRDVYGHYALAAFLLFVLLKLASESLQTDSS